MMASLSKDYFDLLCLFFSEYHHWREFTPDQTPGTQLRLFLPIWDKLCQFLPILTSCAHLRQFDSMMLWWAASDASEEEDEATEESGSTIVDQLLPKYQHESTSCSKKHKKKREEKKEKKERKKESGSATKPMSTSCSQNINTQTLLVPLVAKKKQEKTNKKEREKIKGKKQQDQLIPKYQHKNTSSGHRKLRH